MFESPFADKQRQSVEKHPATSVAAGSDLIVEARSGVCHLAFG